MVEWYLECFGGLRVVGGERVVERFRTQKTASTLALLALKGTQSREDVCALLWADVAPEAARNSLSAALSALRREFGDEALRADRTHISLASGIFTTDLEAFDAALKNREFERATEIFRGPLLPGFYEEPFLALAGEYQEKARLAFGSRLEELEHTGNAEVLRSVARRAISVFGNDERWFLALMRAHFMAGDLEAALRVYETLGRWARKNNVTLTEEPRLLAKTLRREKEDQARQDAKNLIAYAAGSEDVAAVGEPFTSHVAAVISEALVVPAVAPSQAKVASKLPTQWTRFFGRESERAMLQDWLQGGERLITVSGAGGSGKTRLAIETVREVAPQWEQNRHVLDFVPLASLADPDLLFPTICDSLGLGHTPDVPPLEQLERELRGTPCLFVLDNFEQLAPDGAAHLQVLRERLPEATFLVTSRVLLRLPGEREFPLTPLPTPLQGTPPDEAAQFSSVALFCDRANLKLDATNSDAIGALCRRLDGIPLALELAAARARLLSPAQILERLELHPDFLQSREFGIPDRHKTLRATIEWSVDLLPAELRTFFTRLSVFQGGWTLEAAEAVCTPGLCEAWEAIDLLTQLRECSLIVTQERNGRARFGMLETLREFGLDALDAAQLHELRRASFQFFLQVAKEAAPALQGPNQASWLAQLETEQDNFRAVLAWALEHEPVAALELVAALSSFWETRGHYTEGRDWIERVLPLVTPAPGTPEPETQKQHRARALCGSGFMAFYGSQYGPGRPRLEQGLALFQQLEDRSGILLALGGLAVYAAFAHDFVGMNIYIDRMLEHLDACRTPQERAAALPGLAQMGILVLHAADAPAVRAINTEIISLARAARNASNVARGLVNESLIFVYEGDYEAAQRDLDEALKLLRELNDPYYRSYANWILGETWRSLGDLELARNYYHEALDILIAFKVPVGVPFVLESLALIAASQGHFARAAFLFGAANTRRRADRSPAPLFIARHVETTINNVREGLGEGEFERIWQEGASATVKHAVTIALDSDTPE